MYSLYGFFDTIPSKVGFVIPIFEKDGFLFKGITHNGAYSEFLEVCPKEDKFMIELEIVELSDNHPLEKVGKGGYAILVFKGRNDYFKGKIDSLRLDLVENGILDEVRDLYNSDKNLVHSNLYYDLLCFLGIANRAYQFGLEERSIHSTENFVQYYTFDKMDYDLLDFLNYYAKTKPYLDYIPEDYIDAVEDFVFIGLYVFKLRDLKKVLIKIEQLMSNNPEDYHLIETIKFSLQYSKKYNEYSKESPLPTS